MSESKHTAGPWHQDGHNLSAIIRCTVPRGHPDAKHTCGDYETVARCEGDNWAANARLIAAAPDLLEALREMVRWNVKRGGEDDLPLPADEQDPEVAQAMAAIARAEGR